MNDLLTQPACVLVLFIATALLWLFGSIAPGRTLWRAVAGTSGSLAAWGILAGEVTYWPLVGAGVAIGLWWRLIMQAHAPLFDRVALNTLWATGIIGFSVANGDDLTPAIADATAVLSPLLFPRFMHVAARHAASTLATGDRVIGRLGTVAAWSGGFGVIRVRGDLWLARSAIEMSHAWQVLITGADGRSLLVESAVLD